MLKLAGETESIRERIELISYSPGLQNTGDLETGTHTIVPTSRPAIGSAQYSHSLTLPEPSDARVVVKRIAARLSVNITGLGTATHVYCSVRVDADDTDHELFNLDWTSTGTKLDVVTKNSGTLFNLLKDGSAHTFYFLFWADQANQATIDLVQLWEGVGYNGTAANIICLEIKHTGLVTASWYAARLGTGAVDTTLYNTQEPSANYSHTRIFGGQPGFTLSGSQAPTVLCLGYCTLSIRGSVTTDLNYLYGISLWLRSEE